MNEFANDLAGKVQAALPLFLERGEVYLFALFERTDLKGKWDLLISSSQVDLNAETEVRFFADRVLPTLSPTELRSLSRMMPIKSTDPALLALTSALHVEGGRSNVTESNLNGLYIMNAVLFRSVRPLALKVSD